MRIYLLFVAALLGLGCGCGGSAPNLPPPGDPVPPDNAVCAEHPACASCAQGSKQDCERLMGDGVQLREKDPARAKALFTTACFSGPPRTATVAIACAQLGDLVKPKDLGRARELYKRSCDNEPTSNLRMGTGCAELGETRDPRLP